MQCFTLKTIKKLDIHIHIHIHILHSAITERQASDTHIEKLCHFKTVIAAKPEVVGTQY